MHRDNLHALGDELTLRFGWYDVTTNPCAVAFQVFTVLSRRGYDLPFRRCPKCFAASELDLLGA